MFSVTYVQQDKAFLSALLPTPNMQRGGNISFNGLVQKRCIVAAI
jgi:hypothetical protein